MIPTEVLAPREVIIRRGRDVRFCKCDAGGSDERERDEREESSVTRERHGVIPV
jgi:hypothetical protein